MNIRRFMTNSSVLCLLTRKEAVQTKSIIGGAALSAKFALFQSMNWIGWRPLKPAMGHSRRFGRRLAKGRSTPDADNARRSMSVLVVRRHGVMLVRNAPVAVDLAEANGQP